ncbi:TetR/AcrR family transcriptional regulator [Solirubrobacter soli]|uniref:TetR/AcrR family transcriptional regulator n=1 Tax=Solirubrobacter soli TaxID=363832 RepID=UPI000428EF59|nr:TetR/AcrR family transcriptional regulator [Solirubrobacter soli]
MTDRTYTTPQGRGTRERIIEVAIRVFASQGFRGVPLDVIAAEAGVSRQGILYHFESKAELLLAVLEQHEQDNAERFAELLEVHDHALVPTMRAYMRAAVENRGLIRMLLVLAAEAMDSDHPGHAFFVERYRKTRADVEGWVAQGQEAGRLSTAMSAKKFAAVVVALADGLQLQEYLDEGSVDLEETIIELLELMQTAPPGA